VLLKWLREKGLPHMPDLKKETLEDLLARDSKGQYRKVFDLEPEIIRVLEIRSQLARASTKKLEKMLETVSRDGRVRGLLQYHGAGTGRWAGRLVQPQNFPRALFKEKMEDLIRMIMEQDIELLDFLYGSAMDAIATSLRGMFIAAQGKTFRICDFSAIEARVTFWVAMCDTGLDVFHKSDRGESEDIYCVTASDLVGFEVKKALHSHERQLGKITVLGCGYQMGWSKLQFQAEKDYKVILEDHEAQHMVNLYRDKYEEVKWLWYGLNDAAISTVRSGKPHSYGMIVYELVKDAAGQWLTCILPNGRRLWYYEPVIERVETPWGVKDGLTYMGRDNKKGGSWGRIRTYGGMLTENVVQAIARDLMAESMIRVEAAGYPIVLTVHDEVISETPLEYGSQKEFETLMAMVPPWAEGCPIAVEGGSVTRYQKVG
jgi:DNA polymerase